MSAEANAAAARRILEAFDQGRVEVFDEICSADVVSHDPAEPDDVRGIEAHKQRALMYRTMMPDMHVTLEDLFAGGDKVASRWKVTGTHDGDVEGMPATHRHVEITGMSIDRFDADGRLVETWDQWDSAGFMAQLGLTPETATSAS